LSRAKNRSRGTARKTKKQSGRIGRWLLSVLVAGVVLVGGGAGAVWWWLQAPLVLEKPGIELSIEPGTPPQQVAQAWVAAGVQTDPRFLYAWFRYSGQARKIRAGSYEIHAGVTPRELLDKMVRGDQVLEQLRLIEGWNFRQLRAAIAAAPALKQTTAAMTDAQIMAALGAPGQAPEGRFFPDTYAYSLGVSDLTVLKRAHVLMQKRLESAWAGRGDGLPLKSADDRRRGGPRPGRGGVREPAQGRHAAADRSDGDLRPGHGLRRQPAQDPSADRHAVQHLHPRRSAADADRDAGSGRAAGDAASDAVQGAVLRVARGRHQPVQRGSGRA
jgi:hypothetical protein